MADAPPTSPPPSPFARYMALSSRQITTLLSRSDIFLIRLNRLLSTPSGVDTALCTICYFLTLVHARLSALLASRLQSLAETIAKNASDTLLPGETLVATIPAPEGASRLAYAADSTKRLADLIADVRIFVRLWDLLKIYAWGRKTYLEPPKDRALKVIAWTQVGVNAAYQLLENGAYLAQHGILDWTERKQTRWWLWSSRFWAAHVALDLARLGRQRHLRKREAHERGGEEKEGKIERRKEEALWLKEVIVNAAYAPMTIHWSLEEGVISESMVGLLGTIAGGVSLRDKWMKTA
ncbi:hypothetical protein NA57DRAFT_70622 [Rhizodiscina lignyota]|uniref:Peroxisomal biogenesis factor 11 n=1 Tax=Rhizodiscina lignyota TaxID=1504668 RepID=A0A9P4IS64_9PEZI|nr:hypothetical protein NA57DRAFT_70622 [Rhizodiscina lignyota]